MNKGTNEPYMYELSKLERDIEVEFEEPEEQGIDQNELELEIEYISRHRYSWSDRIKGHQRLKCLVHMV